MKKRNNHLVNEKSKHLTLKVITGYLFFAVIAFGSILYILSVIKEMSTDDGVDQLQREKKFLITRTISLLNESASIGQPIGMTEEHFERFNQALDETSICLEQFRELLTDSLHIQGVDTIEVLLENKRSNTLQLYSIWNDMNSNTVYKNLKGTVLDTITQVDVKEQVQTRKDSVIITRKKKSFFRRLADAFVPPKEEVGIVVNTTSDLQTDTTRNVYSQANVQDKLLKEFQATLEKERKKFNFKLYDKAAELRHNDVLINARINQILYAIEEEETAAAIERLDNQQELYRETTRFLGGVAIVAILVILGFLFIISRDISRSRYYRIQLEKAKQYAEGLLVKQEKFMLAISHDIRAPMSSIIGYIELLLRRKPDERQRYYLENMVSSSNHILSLVNDLLDFHRLDSGKMEINKVAFNVQLLFNDIFLSFKPIADAKKLTFRMDMNPVSTDLKYYGDTIRIRQIASNLLSNALKFTQKGEVVLSVSVCDEKLHLSVQDTGPGIPEEEQQAIFGEFTRLKNEKKEGFGLGLSITRKLIDLMQGSILLESKPGEGSNFCVTIPLDEVGKSDLLSVSASSSVDNPELKIDKQRIRCLLVDDDPLQLALTEELLKQNVIEVETCTDPNRVIDLLKKKSFDVVISDIQMPGMDGFELVKLIRDSAIPKVATLPVIALSASVANQKEVYLNAGFTGFLNKPFTAKELISVLNDLLATNFATDARLDFSSLTDFAGGDKEALNEILETFKQETATNMHLLKATITQSDRAKASKIAHKMIPVFSMIGANHLVQRLRLLEKNDSELSDEAWVSLITEIDCQVTAVMDEVLKQKCGG